MDYFFYIELKNIWKMVLKFFFTNDRSVIITTLRHVFSEKIIITAVNNGARTVIENTPKVNSSSQGLTLLWSAF